MIARLLNRIRRRPAATSGVGIALLLCLPVLAAPLDPFSQGDLTELRRAMTTIGLVCESGTTEEVVAAARVLRDANASHPDIEAALRGAGGMLSPREIVTGADVTLRRSRAGKDVDCRRRAAAALDALHAS